MMDVWSIGYHWQNFFDLGFSTNYFGPSGDPVLIVLPEINSRSSRHICHWLSLREFGVGDCECGRFADWFWAVGTWA